MYIIGKKKKLSDSSAPPWASACAFRSETPPPWLWASFLPALPPRTAGRAGPPPSTFPGGFLFEGLGRGGRAWWRRRWRRRWWRRRRWRMSGMLRWSAEGHPVLGSVRTPLSEGSWASQWGGSHPPGRRKTSCVVGERVRWVAGVVRGQTPWLS